ncbi:ExeM/NucH family extracellular endonuclease [Marinobacter sp. M1N3S26]|uniref:ExeM/NucH family extracellular endonuclease n=1 Tax=Marinobacter sp. M1N3S26 TaxID=3382299 RepID=UPI00387B320D
MLRTVVALLLYTTMGPLWAASCGDAHNPVSDIQGRGGKSPMAGRQVTVEGILTVDVRQPGGFQGFYLQQALAEQDEDPATSEGLFVHTRAREGKPGDRVRVRGEVREYYGLTSLTNVRQVATCASPGLPAPTALQPGQLPEGGHEALEGMLVQTTEPLVITDTWNLARFGELVLAPSLQWTPTQRLEPGPETHALLAQQEQQRLILDDGLRRKYPRPIPYLPDGTSPGNPLRVGDRIAPVAGVMDYRFGNWRLQPLTQPDIYHATPRQMPPTRHREANLRVVSLNLGNLFNGDGQGQGFPTARGARDHASYQQQLARLSRQIQATDPDILAVSELENDGYGDNSALAELARTIGDHWRFIEGGTDQDDDVIRNALLYRSDRVQPTGPATLINDGAFRQWHRPALAQAFRRIDGGAALTVIAVHLKSKGCHNAPAAQQDRRDGQACFAEARESAARALGRWRPDGNGKDHLILLAGDFNAYAREAPLQVLGDTGYTDLIAHFHGLEQGTFRYHGRLGTLDYHLANDALMKRVKASHIWSVNAEEPRLRAYNATTDTDVPEDSPWRASDHNPVMTDLRL